MLDVYAYIGSKVFGVDIKDCMEWKNNKPNIDGKNRRDKIKQILLKKLCTKNLDLAEQWVWAIILELFPGIKELEKDSSKIISDDNLISWLKQKVSKQSNNEICKYYITYKSDDNKLLKSVCYGTKDAEECYCKELTKYCTHYPERRSH